MAFSNLTEVASNRSNPSQQLDVTIPVSQATDWVTLRPAGIDTADNSGNTITNPNTSINSAAKKLLIAGVGTGVLLRLNYLHSALTTAPVIQVFGIDANNVPMRLYNATGAHELALPADAANDIDDATNSYTLHVQLDAKGCKYIVVGIKTAGAGGAAATAIIQGKVI